MAYRFLADAVLVLHLGFLLFVILGGALVFRWPRLAWIHVPAFSWGAVIEFAGWICPLTPLENHFRELGGRPVYASGFIEHYVLPCVYPAPLTRDLQIALGLGVLVLNGGLYALLIRNRVRKNTQALLD